MPINEKDIMAVVENGELENWLAFEVHGSNLLTLCLECRRLDWARKLLLDGYPPDKNNYGFVTASLTEAVRMRYKDGIWLLRLFGAAPDGHIDDDEIPLQVALCTGSTDLVETVLAAGANPTLDPFRAAVVPKASQTEEMHRLLSRYVYVYKKK